MQISFVPGQWAKHRDFSIPLLSLLSEVLEGGIEGCLGQCAICGKDFRLSGVSSFSQSSTPLANPMSHSSVENTLDLSESVCLSRSFHPFGMGKSPKSNS